MRPADRVAADDAEAQATGVCEAHELALLERERVAERLERLRVEGPRSVLIGDVDGGVVDHRSPPSTVVTVAAHDPRKRRRPHHGPVAARRACARDRGRADRGRGRHARDPRFRLRRSSTSAGAASSPGSRTRTSTSRPGRSGQRDLSLDGVGSLDRGARAGASATPRAGWIRGQGWRSADWEAQPTKEALDEVTGETPAALWAKDLHSLWLNSAALALAGGDLEVEGGVVERDDAGEPTGVLREEAAWRFRERFPSVSEDEWLEVTRAGCEARAQPRRDRGPRQGRLGRRARDLPAAARPRRARRSASGSRSRTRSCRSSRRSGSAPASATTSCGSAT